MTGIPSRAEARAVVSGQVLLMVYQGDEVGERSGVLDVKGQGDEFPNGFCLGKKSFDSGVKG